jgi:hypothetical protein
MALPLSRASTVIVYLVLGSCKSCHESTRESDPHVDEGNDPEEADDQRDNFWRVRIEVVGAGDASTADKRLACVGDVTTVTGACGPLLLRFKEREPPLLRATATPGWHFDHWSSVLTEPDGSTHPRPGSMPDGVLYLNGFGYSDTGELDTVTVVFLTDR